MRGLNHKLGVCHEGYQSQFKDKITSYDTNRLAEVRNINVKEIEPSKYCSI